MWEIPSREHLRFLTDAAGPVGQLERMRITSSGLVEIGTSTASSSKLSIQTHGTTDILNLFETGGQEVFTVLESGNVGIGTSSPASRLDVWGDFRVGTSSTPALAVDVAAGQVMIGTTTPYSAFDLYLENSSLAFRNTASPADSALIYSDASGALVGSSSAEMYLSGADSRISLDGTGFIFNDTGDDRDFRVEGNGNENLLFIDAGNDTVGIGTSSPLQTLQVYGDIRVGQSGTNGCLERYDGGVLAGSCVSDETLKTNIVSLTAGRGPVLEDLVDLMPVTYNWNETAHEVYAKGLETNNIGLLAQDVESSFPELVTENQEGFMQVDFSALPFYIVQALKEMWAVVTGNRDRIAVLEARISALEAEQGMVVEPAETQSSSDTSSDSTGDVNVDTETSVSDSAATSTVDTATSSTQFSAASDGEGSQPVASSTVSTSESEVSDATETTVTEAVEPQQDSSPEESVQSNEASEPTGDESGSEVEMATDYEDETI